MWRIDRVAFLASLLAVPIGAGSAHAQDVAGSLNDAIVGTWAGEVSQGESKFQTRLTFVSPKGGISRYPGFPCGGTLTGDRKGDGYQFDEVVTWGGTDEKTDGCIGGLVKITVDATRWFMIGLRPITGRIMPPPASCGASARSGNCPRQRAVFILARMS